MDQLLNSYYENNLKRLYEVVDQIFYRNFGGISDKDMSEYYSVAGSVLADIVLNNKYDPSKGDFDGYLYNTVKFAVIDELKKQQRNKRCAKVDMVDENGKIVRVTMKNIYLDAPVEDSEGLTIGDTIPSDFNLDDILEEKENCQDERVEKYLNSLSGTARKIIEMRMNDIPVSEIKKKLGLTDREYSNHMHSQNE